jgi:hypothetical protein
VFTLTENVVRINLNCSGREVYVDDVKTGMGGATGNKVRNLLEFIETGTFNFLYYFSLIS